MLLVTGLAACLAAASAHSVPMQPNASELNQPDGIAKSCIMKMAVFMKSRHVPEELTRRINSLQLDWQSIFRNPVVGMDAPNPFKLDRFSKDECAQIDKIIEDMNNALECVREQKASDLDDSATNMVLEDARLATLMKAAVVCVNNLLDEQAIHSGIDELQQWFVD